MFGTLLPHETLKNTLPFAVNSDESPCVPENSQSSDSVQGLVSPLASESV